MNTGDNAGVDGHTNEIRLGVQMAGSEYIIEFRPQGRYVRVTAIDPTTGTEAVMVGSARDSQQFLQTEAIKKLEYILKK
jgi:hypothetical protein